MPERSNIKMRDIVAKTRRVLPPRPSRPKELPIKIKKEAPIFIPVTPAVEKRRRLSPKIIYITAGALAVAGVSFGILEFFMEVRVSVAPRQEFVDISDSVAASASSSGAVSLEEVSVEETIELESPIETSKNSTQKASGKVVIYNAYSTQSQTLVASTRLEAPNGKIYRIPEIITVPGAKTENGRISPSSIEVTVFADKSGPEYNLGLSDFTIPGFKGSAKYEKFYGRSKTEITGGFSGSSKVVLQGDIDALLKRAEDSFRNILKEKIERDLPQGIFLPKEAVEIKVTLEVANPPVNSPAEKVSAKIKGVARAMAFKRSELVSALAEKHLSLEEGESIDLKNLENLNFEVLTKSFENKTMTLSVKGRANFVWLFDEELLKRNLSGASRSTRQGVFKNYSSIERAEIIFVPSWWRVFPNNTGRIKIEKIIKENP